MKTSNRDLLVLLKDEAMTNQAIEHEVSQLNEILFHIESADTFFVIRTDHFPSDLSQ